MKKMLLAALFACGTVIGVEAAPTDAVTQADLQAIIARLSKLEAENKAQAAKIAELDHWTDKQETRAAVDNLIRDTLWAELPECYDEISISEYRQRIYEYVYTRYRVAA